MTSFRFRLEYAINITLVQNFVTLYQPACRSVEVDVSLMARASILIHTTVKKGNICRACCGPPGP